MWRFLYFFLFARFSSPIQVFDTCHTSFTVLPTDLDPLLHMNNGRYFSLMDLARFDYGIRSGQVRAVRKHHLYTVVASEMIRFKKSLNFLQRFEITTHTIGWDSKFFYVEHYFIVGNTIHALGMVKICFMRKGKIVSPNEILSYIGVTKASPPLPSWVLEWQKIDNDFYQNASKGV